MGNAKWEQFAARMRELTDLGRALSLLSWDQSVVMPGKAAASRARATATLDSLTHSKATDPGLGDLIDDLIDDPSLDDLRRRSVEVAKRDYDKATKVPDDLVRALAEATGIGYQVWTEARPASDFAVFEPHLEKIVALRKEYADAVGYANERYDALLDDYEPGLTAIEVETVFAELIDGLEPIVDRVLAKAGPAPAFLRGKFDVGAQEAFCQWLVGHLGFDTAGGRLDVSPHPFTIQISAGDTRQTTRYTADELLSSVYAAIHETGHALYDQGLPEEWLDLPIGHYSSLAMHESQSRMWENQVGRSREFVGFLLSKLKERFESSLGGVTPDEFYEGVNHPERSLIRVEADELTYNLHIVLRFELELAMFRDELAVADLPEAWNKAVEQHVGLRPSDDRKGVLQDMHWSGGMQGYFPTYTLGTLYAAAFYAKAETDLGSLEGDLKRGETRRLLEWLRANIHSKANRYDTKVAAEKVLGAPFSPKPFLDYLETKYFELYDA
jgi:carboxypeptidase Taq